jgi:hypothetical protein
MSRGGAGQKACTIATDVEEVCHDRFPHLRGDFTTCTKPCTQPWGHRLTTPHRCDDSHEWSIDSDGFLAMPQPPES